MGADTKIEWADHTWNGWRGCEHSRLDDGSVHPGCAHCYAAKMAPRNPKVLGVWGPAGVGKRVRGTDEYWKLPLKWNAAAEKAGVRASVFSHSLADVFEDWKGPIHDTNGNRLFSYVDHNASGTDGSIGLTMGHLRLDMFDLIDRTEWLDWILVTKRPQNVPRMWPLVRDCELTKRRNNVRLLTSVSNQETADELIPHLLKCRDLCPVLGLSCEPLLGPLILDQQGIDIRRGTSACGYFPDIDWVIVGGESGPHARPMHPGWARSVRDQCQAAGVPFFFKQWGEWLPHSQTQYSGAHYSIPRHKFDDDHLASRVGKKSAGRLLDGREWSEVPPSYA